MFGCSPGYPEMHGRSGAHHTNHSRPSSIRTEPHSRWMRTASFLRREVLFAEDVQNSPIILDHVTHLTERFQNTDTTMPTKV